MRKLAVHALPYIIKGPVGESVFLEIVGGDVNLLWLTLVVECDPFDGGVFREKGIEAVVKQAKFIGFVFCG